MPMTYACVAIPVDALAVASAPFGQHIVHPRE